MFIRMAALAAFTLLSVTGCSSVNTKLNSTVASTITLTHADLQTAIAMAISATPPDIEAATCYAWIDSNLNAVQTVISSAMPTTPIAGVFSTFEVGHLAVNNVQNGISLSLKTGFETNCGPLTANVIGGIQGLITTISNDATTISTFGAKL